MKAKFALSTYSIQGRWKTKSFIDVLQKRKAAAVICQKQQQQQQHINCDTLTKISNLS